MMIAIIMGGDLGIFISLEGFMITVGGTMAATLVNYPMSRILTVLKVLRVAFNESTEDLHFILRVLVDMSEKARRDGLLALEEEAEALEDQFIKDAVQMVVDGTEPDVIKEMLESQIEIQQARHREGQGVFSTMGAFSPAFGMIGTLIGLITMLSDLDNPDAVGPGMSVALITTLYGVVMANLIFLPIAGKLKVKSMEEMYKNEMILEGILAVQRGENPRIVQQRLITFLSPEKRNEEYQGEGRVTNEKV